MNDQKEEKAREQNGKKVNGGEGDLSDNDDGFIDENGTSYFHHDIIFEEDVP